MPRLPIMKSKDFLKALLAYGCIKVSIRGSHHKIMYPPTNMVSIIPVHAGEDTPPGLFTKILKDLGIDINDFLSNL